MECLNPTEYLKTKEAVILSIYAGKVWSKLNSLAPINKDIYKLVGDKKVPRVVTAIKVILHLQKMRF